MGTNNTHKKPVSKKKKGISGRSSNADKQSRINIGKSLLIMKSFKTKNQFYRAYKKRLSNSELQPPESIHTLSSDLTEIKKQLSINGITFDHMKKISAFEKEGNALKGKITHINISVNGYENTLYDEQHKIYLKDYTKFRAPFLRIYKNNAIKLITTKTKLKHRPMIHLYIITHDESNKDYTELSSTIVNLFLTYHGHDILYASAHMNCAEIVFYKKDYNLILFNTFCLAKSACS